ncbi:MAG: hypothetical protein K1X53_12735 [Candidatus Sumerlaeaceae bacterium]|nr:hypothetical protein [Candidatus Sumerlaeaceae bacterium]
MPILAKNKHRYPANWRSIRAAILERAHHSCEFCGRPNHVWATRLGAWCWTKTSAESIWPGERAYKIVLTIAHLDGNPEHNDGMDAGGPVIPTWRIDESNLRALCQRCHNRWDAPMRVQNRRITRRGRMACGDLFDHA